MSELHVKSLAPWVGTNAQMTTQIVRQIGPNPRAYWEVFLGGGSTLLEKKPSPKESINDIHPVLMNMVAVLASERCGELNERLANTTFAQSIFDDAVALLSETFEPPIASATKVSDAQLAWAWAAFVQWWMGKGGMAGGPGEGSISIRYDSRGGSMPSRFRSACDSVLWFRQRLARVGIYNMDTMRLLEKIEDRVGTVIYADPTFIEKDHLYTYTLKTKKASEGMFDPSSDDHDRLSELLRRYTDTRVVLRYYNHQRIPELYPDWWLVDCSRTKQITNSIPVAEAAEREPITAPDILLINQPPIGDTT